MLKVNIYFYLISALEKITKLKTLKKCAQLFDTKKLDKNTKR